MDKNGLANAAVGAAFVEDARFTYLPMIAELSKKDKESVPLFEAAFDAARDVYFEDGSREDALAAARKALGLEAE